MGTPVEILTAGIAEDMREVKMVWTRHVNRTSLLASYHGHISGITNPHILPGRQLIPLPVQEL